jgi:hypothetical protein
MSVRTPTETTGAPPGGPDHEDGPGLSLARRVTLVVVFAALLGVLVVGLVSRRSGGNDAAVARVSPTVAPPTTAIQPPPLIDTGEDWNAIVRSMIAYNDWLYLHPKPELLDAFSLPSAPLYAETKLALTNLATKGWHYDPPRPSVTIEIVRLNSRVNAKTAAVFVRFGPSPQYRVVDQSGAEVAIQPAIPTGNSVIWTLAEIDGRWRLADVTPL